MNKSHLLNLYYTMFLSRKFEEKIEALFGNNEIRGTTHLSIGQEAVAVGACSVINKDDYVTSNHRGHSHAGFYHG